MRKLRKLNTNDLVFIDIETARLENELTPDSVLYESWKYKMRYTQEDVNITDSLEDLFKKKAALYPEFAKIVCITIGKITDGNVIKLKSYSGENETELLTNFVKGFNAIIAHNPKTLLTGFNIIMFDIPFINVRCVINGIEAPALFDLEDPKPWTVPYVDIASVWKGTAIRGASLLNCAIALGLKSPKNIIEGSEVSDVYYNIPDAISIITQYCEQDVITTIHIFNKCRFEDTALIDGAPIEIKEPTGRLQTMYATKTIDSSVVKDAAKLKGRQKDIAEKILKVATDAN